MNELARWNLKPINAEEIIQQPKNSWDSIWQKWKKKLDFDLKSKHILQKNQDSDL